MSLGELAEKISTGLLFIGRSSIHVPAGDWLLASAPNMTNAASLQVQDRSSVFGLPWPVVPRARRHTIGFHFEAHRFLYRGRANQCCRGAGALRSKLLA